METLNKVDKMAAGLLEKMPELLQKGGVYGGELFDKFITYSLCYEISQLILFCGVIYFLKRFVKELDYNSEIMETIMCVFSCSIIIILACFIALDVIPDIIKILTFPELYLIDYFKAPTCR